MKQKKKSNKELVEARKIIKILQQENELLHTLLHFSARAAKLKVPEHRAFFNPLQIMELQQITEKVVTAKLLAVKESRKNK